jgi:hypothetical protein
MNHVFVEPSGASAGLLTKLPYEAAGENTDEISYHPPGFLITTGFRTVSIQSFTMSIN